jgi:hypothetical protein
MMIHHIRALAFCMFDKGIVLRRGDPALIRVNGNKKTPWEKLAVPKGGMLPASNVVGSPRL